LAPKAEGWQSALITLRHSPDDHHLAASHPAHFKLSKNVGLLPIIGSLLSIIDWPYALHHITLL
jgi:hypothetical protein